MVNVIGTVYWELEIRDTEDHSIHYIRDVVILEDPEQDDFIDYLELTNETILGWVWAIVGKETMEQRIAKELNDMRSIKPEDQIQLSMPWLASCCPDGTGIDQDPTP